MPIMLGWGMMFRLLASVSILALPSTTWAQHATGPSTAIDSDLGASPTRISTTERQQLLDEIEALRSRIEKLEASSAVTVQAAPTAPKLMAPVQVAPTAPKSVEAPAHNLELYGFAQLDAIQDFKRVDPNWDATLRPSRIPTQPGQFGSDGQSVFGVRQSRLGVKADGLLLGKPYEAKVEFDLFGVGVNAGQTTFRLRHAYASWGPLLAGQTTSLFMDPGIFPKIIDFWGPPGMVSLRNPQIRYTFLDGNGWKFAAALEHRANDIDTGNLRLIDEASASNIRSDEPLPDVTAQVRYGGKWGHLQLAAVLRKVAYETPGTSQNEPRGQEIGWGINIGSSIAASVATLRTGVVFGRGIGSYLNDSGVDLAPSVAVIQLPGNVVLVPSATAVKLFGWSSYVDLQWSKAWSSSLGYSFTKVDNTSFQAGSAIRKGEYASANLLWSPAPNFLTGGEFLWGRRTDHDGDEGTDTRVQYSFKWSFSSNNVWGLLEN